MSETPIAEAQREIVREYIAHFRLACGHRQFDPDDFIDELLKASVYTCGSMLGPAGKMALAERLRDMADFVELDARQGKLDA